MIICHFCEECILFCLVVWKMNKQIKKDFFFLQIEHSNCCYEISVTFDSVKSVHFWITLIFNLVLFIYLFFYHCFYFIIF